VPLAASAEAAAPCAESAARPATCMPHCERASGKPNLPFHLFLVIQHSCLHTLIRLRAPLPPPPTLFSPFFHTSAVVPASLTFSPLAALAEYFYCEHCRRGVLSVASIALELRKSTTSIGLGGPWCRGCSSAAAAARAREKRERNNRRRAIEFTPYWAGLGFGGATEAGAAAGSAANGA
jgi:hypothetical protein